MGIWSTMPLLSTLAALVIIVHSAEEDRGYRRDLRPRAVDTASYEQPWRAIDSEPLIPQSTHTDAWNESPEDIPERRRPVRKRKRRPHPYPDGEPLERYQESIQGRHQDYQDSQQTPETRKRRKRPDFTYQLSDEPARPLRRRGVRRKRPTDYYDSENQRTQNYSKYNQFNEYDDTEQTEKTKVHSTSTTDNLANQPYAFDNEEYADISPYNRPISYQEVHNMFGDGNANGNGVYMHPFHESSSSADDDSQERPNINQETKKPSSERIVTEAESDPENDKIMIMIKKSKVKDGTISIINTGTERNYFPVPMPTEITYIDYNSLSTDEEKSDSTIFNGTGLNYVYFPIPADETDTDNGGSPAPTEESKTTIANVTEQNYFYFPIPAEVPYTDNGGSPAPTEESKTTIANVTEQNYFYFPIPAEVPYTDNGGSPAPTEESKTTIINVTEQNYFYFPIPTEVPYTDNGGLPAPTEELKTTIINVTEQNYFYFPIPTEVPYTDNSGLPAPTEESKTTIINVTEQNYFYFTIPAHHGLPATKEESKTVVAQTINATEFNYSNFSKSAEETSNDYNGTIPTEVPYTDNGGLPAPTEESKTTIINVTAQNYFYFTIPAHHGSPATKEESKTVVAQTINGTEVNYSNFSKPAEETSNDYNGTTATAAKSNTTIVNGTEQYYCSKEKSNTPIFNATKQNYILLLLPAVVANTNNNVTYVTSEESTTTTKITNNTANTRIKTTTALTTTTITTPLDKIPTETSDGENYGYDNELIVYMMTTEPTAKNATIASTYNGDDIPKIDINIDDRNKDSEYIYFPKLKQDVIVTDAILKNIETTAKSVVTNFKYSREKTRDLINVGSIKPKYFNFRKSKPDVVFAYGTSKNHEPVSNIVGAFSKHSTEKSISVIGVDNSNIEPKYRHFPELIQDVVSSYGSSKNNKSATKSVASRSKYKRKKSRGKISLRYGRNESKYLNLPILNQYADVTSKTIEPKTKIAETASTYSIEKNKGVLNVDYGRIKPKYKHLLKLKQDDVIAHSSLNYNEPAPKFVQTDFRNNIENSKGILNVDYDSVKPKYTKLPKSKQDLAIAYSISKNIEAAPRFIQTDFRKNTEKSKRVLYEDGRIEPKYINLRKSKQDITYYGISKNSEPLAKIVATTPTFTPKSKGKLNLDYGSKESQYKLLFLSQSKQHIFDVGSSKNDESRKDVVASASASNFHIEKNNGISNVDYGLYKYKKPAVKMIFTDLKNIEKPNYAMYLDYETIESKGNIEESNGAVRYNIKRKPKDGILQTLVQKPSNFWDIVPKKFINTDKWISSLKLQIPRITPVEYKELPILEEDFEENGVIDPLMLKQILKRSNGTSLSEILQQHNLSLADLLQGKNEAISALNISASQESKSQIQDISLEKAPQLNEAESKYPTAKQKSLEQKVPIESSSDEDTNETTTLMVENVTDTGDSEIENQTIKPRMSARRRFPSGIRRKLRMRPMLNSTLKAKLSRDYILIAPTARKYSYNNRNVTKSREWKEIVPLMVDRSTDKIDKYDATESTITTTDAPIDTTISSLEISNSSYSLPSVTDTSNVKDNEVENTVITTTDATTTITIEVTPPFDIDNETEKPKVTPIVRPAANNSVLRRQAFNNRLKRKRLKQKSTTENPSDDLMKNFLGMANLVSASQFIERTQKPYTTKQENTEYATELEDFMTTKTPKTVDGGIKSTQITISSSTSTTIKLPQTSTTTGTTEQSAKFEIEEILNDTMTSERLAKILRERNMTLNELVNHRERGSSHVHLADIFHNASKEPNPPEPFLTKSSIEPISKETYPLRAILEANTHETTTRTSSQDQKNYVNIPVVMDFGNNVNENGESMGIISLFNKLTDSEITIDKTEIRKDSDGTPYVSSVINVNATANDTIREGRVLNSNENWNELLSFMKEHNISAFEEDLLGPNKGDIEKDSIEDLDGDGLMILDDMQHLQNFESNIAPGSDENIEIKMFERREHLSEKPGILNKLPNNTKSVAIATASILGLAAILFLLTYIAFKWKQQRNKLRKKESFCVDQIPSPVFENRKTHKNNCSSRSISPMISNTNIYMSTLESHNGKESPDYMWNSLRKPFQ